MKLTEEQLKKAAEIYWASTSDAHKKACDYGLDAIGIRECREGILHHHLKSEAIEETLGRTEVSAQDLHSLKQTVDDTIKDLVEGGVIDPREVQTTRESFTSWPKCPACGSMTHLNPKFEHLHPTFECNSCRKLIVYVVEPADDHQESLLDLIHQAWKVIDSAGGESQGRIKWYRETSKWQSTAAAWRDKYFALLGDPRDLQESPNPGPTAFSKARCTVCDQLWTDHIKPTMKCPT